MQINPQTPLNLSLNVGATNVILAALSGQPYENVATLIATIQQQAAAQLQPAEQPAPAQDSKDPAAGE